MSIEEVTGLSIDDNQTLKDTLRRLAFFAADGSKAYKNALLEHLALNALSRFDPGGHSPGEVRAEIENMIGFDIDYMQVRPILCRLADKGDVYITGDRNDPHVKFGIEVDAKGQIRDKYKKQVEFEENIISKWREEVAENYPLITDSQLDALVEDLHTFSFRVYSQHSLDSMSLYGSADERIFQKLEGFDASSLSDILPARDIETHEIRIIELPQFFRSQEKRKETLHCPTAQSTLSVYMLYRLILQAQA